MSTPWWIERVRGLPEVDALAAFDVGALWNLCQRVLFIRDNVVASELEIDFERSPESRVVWARFLAIELAARAALTREAETIAERFRSGTDSHRAFQSRWRSLPMERNDAAATTSADDFLDALTRVSLLTTGEERPFSGTVNLSSRAHRIAAFLDATQPSSDDVVFDLGSGSGKFALTVAASTDAQVRGIEFGESYVEAARASASFLGLRNVSFTRGDVRDQDLSTGTIFYLYYPFDGAVADAVAATLARIARTKAITLYLQGPEDFLAHFSHTDVFTESTRDGEYSEILIQRSAPNAAG